MGLILRRERTVAIIPRIVKVINANLMLFMKREIFSADILFFPIIMENINVAIAILVI